MIVKLLHNITQLGYTVSFHEDFEGMVRIDYTNESNLVETAEYYEHRHVGCPGQEVELLEQQIEDELANFLERKSK